MGPELMEQFRVQAQRFGAQSIFKNVTRIDLHHRPFRLWADDEEFTADAVIVATGASARLLGLPSEKEYLGYGVSACATCDGFFYRGQEVAVIGGGDTAVEEATFLTKFASKVTIIHRRDALRASKIMQEKAAKNPKIAFLWDSVVVDILGKNVSGKKTVGGVRVKNVKTGTISDVMLEGVFIGIGHQPNTGIFRGQIDMDAVGYLMTKGKGTATNIPGVFAAGDVADSVYRQAITAAGSGCQAALDAERWLEGNG
jgi:thioredoxin reductase (NADPH)